MESIVVSIAMQTNDRDKLLAGLRGITTTYPPGFDATILGYTRGQTAVLPGGRLVPASAFEAVDPADMPDDGLVLDVPNTLVFDMSDSTINIGFTSVGFEANPKTDTIMPISQCDPKLLVLLLFTAREFFTDAYLSVFANTPFGGAADAFLVPPEMTKAFTYAAWNERHADDDLHSVRQFISTIA